MTVTQYIHIAVETWGAIFCMIAAVCVHVTRRFDREMAKNLCRLLMVDAILNICEALAYLYRGNVTHTGYVMVRVTNFAVFVCGYLLALFACRYIGLVIERQGGQWDRGWKYAVHALCGVGIFLLILSRFFGFYYAFDGQNRYYRMPDTYWLMNFLGILPVILLYLIIIRNRKCFKPLQYAAFLVFIILPVMGMVIQTLRYGISLYNITNTVCIMFFFITYEMEYAGYMVEQERKVGQEKERLLKEKITVEKEKVRLLDERIHLYHSQIQPHFIYNSLTAVLSYLPGDAEKAKEVLQHFTGFLRGSMDLLTETECIRAEREFSAVEDYLYMEKERFGEELEVVLDVQDRDFFLPTFTVQTLVENAIRHGIRRKSNGSGTLIVKSYRMDDFHMIEVQDDGVGFDVAVWEKDGRDDGESQPHIGLSNLKDRLEMMCGGELLIESTIGKGTLATVRIPCGNMKENGGDGNGHTDCG